MDKKNNPLNINVENEDNSDNYTTIIESYRCSTSPYNHQGRSLNSMKTYPVTPSPKTDIGYFRKNKNPYYSKNTIEKTKSDPALIKNLNQCIINLKNMLLCEDSNKKYNENFKTFRLYDDEKYYDLSEISSLDLNEEKEI
jgi:hypothetical protein